MWMYGHCFLDAPTEEVENDSGTIPTNRERPLQGRPTDKIRAQKVGIDDLREEAEKLLSILRDPQPGLFTWHQAAHERLVGMRDLISKALGDS